MSDPKSPAKGADLRAHFDEPSLSGQPWSDIAGYRLQRILELVGQLATVTQELESANTSGIEAFRIVQAQRDEIQAKLMALTADYETLKKKSDGWRLDADYHSDCRPNRRQAEAALADAKSTNDKWADEVAKNRTLTASLHALRESLKAQVAKWRDNAARLPILHLHSRIEQAEHDLLVQMWERCADELAALLVDQGPA